MTADDRERPVTADPLPIRDDPNADLSGHLPPPSPTAAWRRFDRLVVVVFCLGLIVPGLLMAARVRPAAIENRPLLQPPALSLGSLLDAAWYAASTASSPTTSPSARSRSGSGARPTGGSAGPATPPWSAGSARGCSLVDEIGSRRASSGRATLGGARSDKRAAFAAPARSSASSSPRTST